MVKDAVDDDGQGSEGDIVHCKRQAVVDTLKGNTRRRGRGGERLHSEGAQNFEPTLRRILLVLRYNRAKHIYDANY